MDTKRILLKYMSEERFSDICNFVETLYLMEYDVLILMARKFYNLFCVFHEENCRKYKRLEIPYRNNGKIITNRALPLIKDDIVNHKYKKVVVADDIIIHGKTIREVYDELVSIDPELTIFLMSYARNDKDTSVYEDILPRMNSRYLLDEYERRALSDEIINIFYLAGRPYISYLPYFTLNLNWKDLLTRLSDKDCLSIQNSDMKRCGIEAYLYVGKELEIFRGIQCCKKCAIRLYYYSQLDKILMIPYFYMEIIEEKFLDGISDYIRQHFLESEYQKLLAGNSPTDEMRIMELEYILSTWMGIYFLNTVQCSEYEWHKEIENYNFCVRILPEKSPSGDEIENYVKKFKEISNHVPRRIVSKDGENNEVQMLLKRYDGLKDKYTTNYRKWQKMIAWDAEQPDYEKRFMSDYLAVNGELDEERSRDGDSIKKRLFGVPVSFILDDMSDYLYGLFGHQEKKENYSDRVFAALITLADSGQGTIIVKVEKEDSSNRYTESVVYADEQNYKFYEYTNFPVMYGLYLIERKSIQEGESEKISERKSKMVEALVAYLESENIFYIREEMLQIATFSLSDIYKNFLQNAYEKYFGNKVLKKAVAIATSICNNTEK